METSESAGTVPPWCLATLDSSLRRSSRVVWKVASDMVVNLEVKSVILKF
jgi:hypothetical protein